MTKSIIATSLILSTLFFGCASKEPLGVIEATDYAMSCNALISEINRIRSQMQTEEDENTAKNIIGKTLTFGIYSADKEKAVLLRARAKSLQLIYTIKEAKNECQPLTKKDIRVDDFTTRTIKNTKANFNESKKALN